jgi:hypothetical protein
MLRDQTAAAAEAKVRRECAGQLRDLESAVHTYRQKAERAERERDALDKQAGELIKRVDEARSLYLAEKSKNADAERKGGYEALTKLIAHLVSCSVPSVGLAIVQSFRDREYAPPAPSVNLGEWVVTYTPNTMAAKWQADGAEMGHKATRFEYTLPALLHAINYTPTPTEYTALVALAGETDA